jgi:hypothetical protein
MPQHANFWRKQRHANAFHFASLAEMAEVEGCNSEQRQKQRRVVVAVDESEGRMNDKFQGSSRRHKHRSFLSLIDG